MSPASPDRPSDPADPRAWWVRLVDAVACLQRKGTREANEYLDFTREHRGKSQARLAKRTLLELAEANSWANCHQWPAWGYQCKPPAVEKPKAAAPKGKRR